MKKVLSNNFMMIKYIIKFCPIHIFISILNAVFSSIISIFDILFLRYIIVSISREADFFLLSLLVVVYMLFNIIYSFVNTWLNQIIRPKNEQILNQKMQEQIFIKALEVDVECYEDAEFYNKFTLAFQQADSRALSVLNTFSSLINSLISITALVTLISSFEPILIIIIMSNVIMSFCINTKTMKVQHEYYEKKIPCQREIVYTQRLFYQKEYAKELRLFSKFSMLMKNNFFASTNKLISLINIYGKKILKYIQADSIISSGSNSLITLYLAYKVLMKTIQVADFIALSSSTQQLIAKISQLLNIFPQIYEHSIYIENFNDYINYVPRIKENYSDKPFPDKPIIELKNVYFTYPKTERTVLKNINIKISYGEKVAFVGLNGAGKSTLIKLITRLYDPTKGNLYLNETRYQEYSVSTIRNNIGIVFQDYQIFAMTIAENILMRPLSGIDDEEIVNNALKFVGLYAKVSLLTNGIYTVLTREFNNQGAVFSGGEFQKLIIARIYARKSRIIILDEPSSALDPLAEKEIFNSINSFAKDRTIILISHKLSNVKDVDRIFLIENGILIETGSHDELIKINGKYAEMYNIQAEKYIAQNKERLECVI